MYILDVVSTQATGNEYFVLGLSFNEFLSLCIALAAFLLSIFSFSRTIAYNIIQNNITLFNERLDLYKYFADFFNEAYLNDKPPTDVKEFHYNVLKLKSLYPKSKRLAIALTNLSGHYLRGLPFPELPSKYIIKSKELSKLKPISEEGTPEWNKYMLLFYINDCFKDIDDSLFIFK